MRLKKIGILILLLVFLVPNFTKADDVFLDNNAVTNLSDVNAHLVVSELNTGKIISKRGENEKVSVGKLPNYLALYLLTDSLKNKKITLDEKINITSGDNILSKYKIESSITVKDAIFLLENENSNNLNQAVFAHFNITLDKAKDILASMSLNDTKLESLDNNGNNTSTAKNISYLTSLILKNYPEITEITKNPEHTLASGEKINNSIEFKESDKFRVLGLDYSDKNSVTYAYSGNTKLIITVLNQSDDKATYFDKLQKTYDYLFSNYNYKLALKAGTYTINNERITFNEDIYDLFYEKHSIKDVTYLLMNKKILLFQKYETITANEGTVFSDFTSNDNTGNLAKIKSNFINDDNFDKKDNYEKTTIVIDRTKYFATGILAIYTLVFAALYVMRQVVRKD
ncbi:MAG: hypothetical protein DI638_08225 [Gemella sp.]|nr:MAG: hypothetical protein DI638_08225 [Gemella sp.]